MRLDRPVLSLCLGHLISSASLAAAQDVPGSGTTSTPHPSNTLSGTGSIETPATMSTTTSSDTRLSSLGTAVTDASVNTAASDSPKYSNSTTLLPVRKQDTSKTAPTSGSSTGAKPISITDLGSKKSGSPSASSTAVGSGRSANAASDTLMTGVPASVTAVSTVPSSISSRIKQKQFAHYPLNNGSDAAANTGFGVGIGGEGGGKLAKISTSALPSGMNLSNIGVYGYTTITIAPTIVRPDGGMAPTKKVTVIPLTRPYKIGVTTISGKATSVIQWLPGATNLADGNSGFNASSMWIGDKAPTMQKSVVGLDVPSTTGPAPAAQSDTSNDVSADGPGVIKASDSNPNQPQASAGTTAAKPADTIAPNALASALGQVKSAAATAPQPKQTEAKSNPPAKAVASTQPQAKPSQQAQTQPQAKPSQQAQTQAQPPPQALPQSQTQAGSQAQSQASSQPQTQAASPQKAQVSSPGQAQTGAQPQAQASSQAQSQSETQVQADSQQNSQQEQQAVNLPSDSSSNNKAPVVILNPENSAVVVSELPVQPAPAQGNTNPEKVIQPQVISTIPTLAPIVPQTTFNYKSATAALQPQNEPVQTAPAVQSNNPSREFETNENSIVVVNKQPDASSVVQKPQNAAASILAEAITTPAAAAAPAFVPEPKTIKVGQASVEVHAVSTDGAAPPEFVVGTQSAKLGQTIVVNSTPVVIETNPAGAAVAKVGSSAAATIDTAPAPVATIGAPGASGAPGAPGAPDAGKSAPSAPGSVKVVLAGQTLAPAAPITIGPAGSATVVSLQTDAAGETKVIAGSSTMPIASFLSQHTDAKLVTTPAVAMPTVNSGTGSVPVNVLVAGSQTLGVNMPAITMGSEVMSLATNTNGLVEVVKASTTMPVASFLAANPSFSVTQMETAASPAPSEKAIAIGSQTLEVGSAITQGTSVISMATDSAGHTNIVQGGSSTVPISRYLAEHPSASMVAAAEPAPSTALTLAGVTVAPVPGATDSAIVIGTATLEPGESVTETFGSTATQTFKYVTLSDGSMGVIMMDKSTTATRHLPTDFLSQNTLLTTASGALPSKTAAGEADFLTGSASSSWNARPLEMLLKAMVGTLLSLMLGFLIV